MPQHHLTDLRIPKRSGIAHVSVKPSKYSHIQKNDIKCLVVEIWISATIKPVVDMGSRDVMVSSLEGNLEKAQQRMVKQANKHR